MIATKNEGISTSPQFPKLMENDGMVVLFTNGNCGTVVFCDDDDPCYKVGYYSGCWDSAEFTDYMFEIVLRNY